MKKCKQLLWLVSFVGSTLLSHAQSNTPPTAFAQFLTCTQGFPLAITLTGSDPDGDPLTYRIVGPPVFGLVTGAPPGVVYFAPTNVFSGVLTDSFVFVANDGQVDSEFAAIQISVIPTNPVVTVLASDAEAAEPPPSNTGTFTFTRTGYLGSELTVLFRVAGTAVLNTDYQTAPPLASGTNSTIYYRTIPAGSNSATLTVIPLADTNTEPIETVVLTLFTNSSYLIGGSGSASVNILDNTNLPSPPVLNLITTDSQAYEAPVGGITDSASFTVTRTGASNVVRFPIIVSGTATYGLDYYTIPAFQVVSNSSTTFFDLGANQNSLTFTLYPLQDNLVEGTETAIFRLGTNTSYTVGPSNQSVISILDGPPAQQLAGIIFPRDRAVFASPESISIKAGGTNALELRLYADDQLLTTSNSPAGYPTFVLTVFTNFPPGEHTLYAVGTNRFGLPANISTSAPVHFQVLAPSKHPMTPIIGRAASADASYAIDVNGALFDWGSDNTAQLGDGIDPGNQGRNVLVPEQIPLGDGTNRWVKAAGGGFHALALDTAGRLYSAGEFGSGQLGQPGVFARAKDFAPVPFPTNVFGWMDIAGGYTHSLGLAADGRLFAWGNNSYGQLGIGSTNNTSIPTLVPFPPGVTAWNSIGAAGFTSLALGSDGNLYSCGVGNELGNGRTANSSSFVQVSLPAGVTNWLGVIAGPEHVLAMGGDGRLYAWGTGGQGQLGNGGRTNALVPTLVMTPSEVTNWNALAVGASHSLGLADNGKLYSWGANTLGQLGPGEQIRTIPTPVPSPVTSWKSVGTGLDHSLAIGNDCNLYAWGGNYLGQLGIGSLINQTNETPVQNLNTLCGVFTNQPPIAFSQFLVATQRTIVSITLTASDSDNDPLTYRIVTPPSLGYLTGAPPSVLYISTTNFLTTVTDQFSFVANDGHTDSFPATVTFLLFPPQTNSRPVITINSTDAVASEVRNSDGTTNTANFTIQRTGDSTDLIQIPLIVGGTATYGLDYYTVPPLNLSSNSHTVFLTTAGPGTIPFTLFPLTDTLVEGTETATFTIGTNSSYTIATPGQTTISILDSNNVPGSVTRISFPPDGAEFASTRNIEIRVATTNIGTVSLYADGGLLASGYGGGGGNFVFSVVTNFSIGSHTVYAVGYVGFTSAPVHFFVLGTNVSSTHSPALAKMPVANSSFVINANGALFDWGYDGPGNLGDGGLSNSLPAAMTLPIQIPLPASGAAWAKVASGGQHTLALDSLGNLYAAGDNSYGQIGVGSSSTTFTNVLLSAARILRSEDVAAGNWHSLALTTDGQIYAWGYNDFGQLGNGTTTNASFPQPVSLPEGVSNWTAIAAGTYHGLALGNDGNAYTWGYAEFGILGNGALTNSPIPQRVVLPTGVTNWLKIAAGGYHNLALAGNGKLYAWGYGGLGTLGSGDTTNASIPIPVNAPSNVNWAAISAGYVHSLALAEDGSEYGWGDNSHGQLGPNASSVQLVPFLITPPSGVQAWQQISAGAFHNLGISDSCMAYSWGSNSLGQLGVGSFVQQTNLQLVHNLGTLCAAVTNQPPIAFSQFLVATQRTIVPITLTASDPDNDPLTYRIVMPPSLGYLTGAPPNVLYISTTNFFTTVTDSFTFVANDGFVDSAPATISILLLPPGSNSNNLPVLSLISNDSITSEALNSDGTTNTATFYIQRAGNPTNDLAVDLFVHGSATYGSDYYTIPPLLGLFSNSVTTVTLPAGSTSMVYTIYPIPDNLTEGTEFAIFTINPSSNYLLGLPSQITVTLLDSNAPPVPGTRVIFPPNGAYYASTLDIKLRVANTNVTSVSIYADDQLLASFSQSPYLLSFVTNFSVGTHTIYSVGANPAISSPNVTSPPVHFTVLAPLAHDALSSRLGIAPTANASFVLDANGALFDFGDGRYGALADGGVTNQEQNTVTRPIQIPLPAGTNRFAKISSGTHHTLALTTDGSLFTCGDNSSGQTGTGHSTSMFEGFVAVPEFAGWKDIAAGSIHSLALTKNGQLAACGNNAYGQLGLGLISKTNSSVFQMVPFPTSVTAWTAIGAGSNYSIALGNNGQLYACGMGLYGMLGTGGSTNSPMLVPVALPVGITNWLKIYPGALHVLASAGNGALYAWGMGSSGQLGNGGTSISLVPRPVITPAGVADWLAVAAGYTHSLGLANNGNLYCWGFGPSGQLGPGSPFSTIPRQVPPPTNVVSWKAIGAGMTHSLGIGDDCRLYAWGANNFGQLGIGSFLNQTNEVPVQNLSSGICPLLTNQQPLALSQFLVSTQRNVLPITLAGLDPDNDPLTYRIVIPPALGILTGAPPNILYISTTNFLTTVTDAFTFVANDGYTDSYPATVTLLLFPSTQSSNTLPIVTITSTDSIASEFLNFDGTTNTANFSIRRTGPTNNPLNVLLTATGTATYGVDYFTVPPLDVSSNAHMTIVPIPAGAPSVPFTVYGTGHFLSNSSVFAQFTLGTNGGYTLGSPDRVSILLINSNQQPPFVSRIFFPPDGAVFASPNNIELRVANTNATSLRIYADSHLLAFTNAPPGSSTFVFNLVTNFAPGVHTVYSVGNTFTSAPVHFFVLGTNASNAKGPSLGVMPTANSSFVIDAHGALFDWGDDRYGNLGDGGLTNIGSGVNVPIQIPLPEHPLYEPDPLRVQRWRKVSAGAQHTLLLGTSGGLYVTGGNSVGQTGIGTNALTVTSVVLDPTHLVVCKDIAAGGQHSLALSSEGRLYAWGFNAFGQLGNGNTTNAPFPQLIPFPAGVTNWTAIAAGVNHSLALDSSGSLYAWGGGADGILGTGGTTNSTRPLKVVLPAGVSFWTNICAGSTHSLALANNGRLYAWGAGFAGQLGIGLAADVYVPTPVHTPGVTNWLALSAGLEHSLAIADNGQLYTWGTGIAGAGITVPFLYVPTLVPNPGGVDSWKAIGTGFGHSLALGDNCVLYSAGLNNFGQLGNGSFLQHTNLQPVTNLDDLCAEILVTETNHAPSFVKGPDITVPEDAGIQVFTNWATQINPGAPSETNQILTFIVTNDNPHLFSTQPGIVPAGNLFFAGAPNSNGVAHVTVVLRDNGGTGNGGHDTSAPQTFMITILRPNHPPVPVVRVFPSFVLSSNYSAFQVISPNGSNALVFFDASLSSDADGDLLSFGWFAHGTNQLFGTSVVATNTLALGSNFMTLTVNDSHVTVLQPFAVDVITPGIAVAELIDFIQSVAPRLTVKQATWRQLIDPLQLAQSEFDSGLWNAGLVHLRIFQARVSDQIGAQDPALANILIQTAQQIAGAVQGNSKHQPSIGSLQNHAANHKSITFTGSPGQVYLVQASSDLSHWDTIGIASESDAGSFQFDDSQNANATARYYRLVIP